MAAPRISEGLIPLPRPAIAARAVPSMIGYRMPPMPGVHRGLPSPYLTLVFPLSGPVPIEIPWRGTGSADCFGIPVGGLHTSPVMLPQHGADGALAAQRGIQLAVHPFAARALFGVPAAALRGEVLELRDLIGFEGADLADLLDDPSGTAAGARVGSWLGRRLAAVPRGLIAPELDHAWRVVVGTGGNVRASEVARAVGWSRRHLTAMMRAEIGVGVKDLARLARFTRSKSLLVSGASLSGIAASCGYVDQSHLTAEWRQFAGCTPGQWIAAELPTLTGNPASG